MRIIYLGSFTRHWNTEVHIADALEEVGCRVDRIEESDFDSESIVRRVEELTASPERLGSPPSPVGGHGKHGHGKHGRTDAIVFLFAKGRLRDAPFEGDPRWLAGVLTRLREETRIDLVACWIFDLLCPEFSSQRFIWSAEISKVCDAFFTTDGYTQGHHLPSATILRQGSSADRKAFGYARTFRKRAVGRPCKYFTCDVAHLGSVYGDRAVWFEYLRREFGDRFKSFDGVRGNDLFDVCESAKVVIGPNFPHYDKYWSNRLYVVAGYGGLFAGPAVDGMRDEGWFDGINFVELPTGTHDAIAKLREVVEWPTGKRRAIRESAAEHAWSKHRYCHRASEMVRTLRTIFNSNAKSEAARANR